MLVLLDLDNTLVDRDSAFATWVHGLARDEGADESAARRVLEVDDSGYGERDDVAAAIRREFGVTDDDETLLDRMRHEHVEHVELHDGVTRALEALAGRGVDIAVLTNGNVKQQTMKLEHVGLAHLVDGAVISESAGLEKPDPEIFRRAVEGRGASVDDAWMVGDNVDADIRGAQEAGLRTGWVSLGRDWPGGAAPTVQAASTAEVLARIADTLEP